MTDRKSLSDEDLTEYASQADNGELSIRQQHELIAQAREEIRLRKMLDGQTLVLPGPPDDPAARAKRELGEWLAQSPERSWTRAELKVGGFSVILTGTDDEGDSYPIANGSGATEHEAITAALRAAKEQG